MKRTFPATVAALATIGALATVSVGATPSAAAAPSATSLRPAAAVQLRESPTPDCADNGNVNPCYEYQTWFWTFDNCNQYAYSHPYDRNRYDRHVCAVFSGGATVGLWFHKVRG
ncbi:hypothetical protein [Streptomyces broussonetiae]|uniref:hypothetical protein n=1 Tax=Streptomyces broussonetiae TaxID=2686304 RepID=UPI0035DBDAF1